MGKKNKQRHIRLAAKDSAQGYKRTHDGQIIYPAAWRSVGRMVGVLNGTVIRDGDGFPVPYSRLLNGGTYAV